MMVSEEDKQSVGYTDMAEWIAWLGEAPLAVMSLARQYPPGVYRLRLLSGEFLRVFPASYDQTDKGTLVMSVMAHPSLNPELPYLAPHRILGVDPEFLTPIKWPPDARVH